MIELREIVSLNLIYRSLKKYTYITTVEMGNIIAVPVAEYFVPYKFIPIKRKLKNISGDYDCYGLFCHTYTKEYTVNGWSDRPVLDDLFNEVEKDEILLITSDDKSLITKIKLLN